MILARNVMLLLGDLVRYAGRSGRWWLPVVVLCLSVAAVIAVTAKAVVPTAVYVLF